MMGVEWQEALGIMMLRLVWSTKQIKHRQWPLKRHMNNLKQKTKALANETTTSKICKNMLGEMSLRTSAVN